MSRQIFINGEWVDLPQIAYDGLPVGFSLPFRGKQAPYGWLVEDGSTLNIATHPALYRAIGTTYGGDGVTTFKLPNSIGKYIRGGLADEVGTELEAGLPNIEGSFISGDYYGQTENYLNGVFHKIKDISLNPTICYASGNDSFIYGFDASKSNLIYGNSDTVTPPSLVALPCIKAFDTIADEVQINLAQELEALKAQIAGAKFVVESWNEGTEWYRVYSDGWIEQGGNSLSDRIINLHKNFTNTSYNIIATTSDSNTTTPTYAPTTREKTVSSFRCANDNGRAVCWFACGY